MKPLKGESLTKWVNAGRPCIAPPVKGPPTWQEQERVFGWKAIDNWSVALDGAVVTWMRPDKDIIQAYTLTPDGTQETVVKAATGQPFTAPGWFMSMDGFQAMIPGEEGMLYREEEPKPRAKPAARRRRGRAVRGKGEGRGRPSCWLRRPHMADPAGQP